MAHVKSLKDAGASIQNLELAKQAVNGFAAVVVQYPGCVNFTSAIENLQGWIEQESVSGTLFKPENAGLSGRLMGSARYYDKELKAVTGDARALCEEFEGKLAEHAGPLSVSKFDVKRWTDQKKMSPELEAAYMKRALQSPHITAIDIPEKYKAATPAPVVETVAAKVTEKKDDTSGVKKPPLTDSTAAAVVAPVEQNKEKVKAEEKPDAVTQVVKPVEQQEPPVVAPTAAAPAPPPPPPVDVDTQQVKPLVAKTHQAPASSGRDCSTASAPY